MRKYQDVRFIASALIAITLIITALLGYGDLRLVGAANTVDGETVTVIVQLEGEPLARFLGNRPREAKSDSEPGRPPGQSLPPLDRPGDESIRKQLERLELQGIEFERNVKRLIPQATVRVRFKTVLNGLAVALPAGRVPLLGKLSGVTSVNQTQKFRPVLDTSVPLINAPYIWSQLGGPGNAGLGQKIAIVDTGIDQNHLFLSDSSLVPPDGYPRGDLSYTTNKVIVARSYPPPGGNFTPADIYGHGTHVAGIAAGVNGGSLSGVAPKAFLMNYNVFGTLDEADTTDIVRAIEDAVNEGADVVNLSLGGPPSGLDDPLVIAVRNGINAGVVFAIAAGNSGSNPATILSPGITPEAITVGASTDSDTIAYFSSRGPNVDLSIKPDVVAPGQAINSSLPGGDFRALSGTSMATPHVAGAAALLRQLHPEWDRAQVPAQVKSALVNTAVFTSTTDLETASVMARGAGRIDLMAAANPGLTVDPPIHSFGISGVLPNGPAASKQFAVKAHAGGDGTWALSVTQTISASGLNAFVSTPSVTVAPNGTASFTLTLNTTDSVPEGDYEGYVTLTKGAQTLHIPYWIRLVKHRTLLPLVYKNTTIQP